MDNELKSGLGYLIPVGAIVGYILALVAESFVWAIIFAAGGILLWFIYLLIMEIDPPRPFGNIIVLFGVLLAISVFLATGLEQDMFGGYLLKTEGLIYAILILFFTVMAGVLFRSQNRKKDAALSPADQQLVDQALGGEGDEKDPRVIVVKQEAPKEEKPQQPEYDYDPYAYTYPPEYYEDEDEEEYDEDDDAYEEDEYEDEYEDDEED